MPNKPEAGAHTGEARVIACTPDWCKSPKAPIPYKTTASLANCHNVSPNVFHRGHAAFHLGSFVTQCQVNEPGTGKGTLSGTHASEGWCKPITAAANVNINGRPAVRHDDWFLINGDKDRDQYNTLGQLNFDLGCNGTKPDAIGSPEPGVAQQLADQLKRKLGTLNDISWDNLPDNIKGALKRVLEDTGETFNMAVEGGARAGAANALGDPSLLFGGAEAAERVRQLSDIATGKTALPAVIDTAPVQSANPAQAAGATVTDIATALMILKSAVQGIPKLLRAEVGLELEESGQLKGPIQRDPTGSAEFIDADGQKWDIKAFNSKYAPKGYELDNAMIKIQDEISLGEHVIIDTQNMTAAHVSELSNAVEKAGLGTKVIFH